ncbi:E3 ubiquitin-protein ligase RNF220-like isoform X2 [Actinia tenebrosa]|nr:E3 ubiquitin-protein ligase RNF220-like isoform X2 [Actinia tenebrosa]
MVLSTSPYQHRPSHLSLYHSQQTSERYSDRVSPDYNPHYFQIHSHLGSGLLHKTSGPTAVFNGTSAFRRISPHEHSFSFHHLQHQRSLLEREHSFESLYHKRSSLDLESERERMSKDKVSPQVTDREMGEYTNNTDHSPNASPRSTHSTESSENNPRFDTVKVKQEKEDIKECCEIAVDENQADGNRRTKAKKSGKTPCCPVCGITIRPGEMESHFAWEMEKANEEMRKTRRSQRESSIQARKGHITNKRVKQENELGIPHDDTPASTRHQTYLRVCANRMARTGHGSKSTRSRSAQSSPVNPSYLLDKNDEGPSGVRSATCPVCESVIHGSGEELNSHVEACLRKRDGNEEVNGQATFDEYEWAGQTRIRATSLLEGGFKASGFQTGIKRKNAEDDGDLNIDGDDSEEYGKAQYSESDIIPCSADEPAEDRARQALRGAVLSGENSPASRSTPTRSRWSEDEGDANHSSDEKTSSKDEKEDIEEGSNQRLVINSLKSRVKDLEKHTAMEKVKCLICMEPYSVPLVSISCWHVHCEECWMRTLGAKKLCPQCNMITSPSDLRRIYL